MMGKPGGIINSLRKTALIQTGQLSDRLAGRAFAEKS
jgi:hypothetical protein